MALSANTVWEVRTGGDDTNGGGFVTGASGTDRSQQDAAHASLTTAATVHTTTTQLNVPVGEHVVHANDIGNIFQINSGTATAGFYQITAVDVGNQRWTVDRSMGTAAQTAAGKMGGCFATPGKAGGAVSVNGHTVYIKAATFAITSATPNIAGGCVDPGFRSQWEGYQTARGDLAAAPLLQASGISTASLFDMAPDGQIKRIDVDGASLTAIRGFSNAGSNRGIWYRCRALNCTNSGFAGINTTTVAVLCSASGCSTAGAAFLTCSSVACEAFDNSVPGFDTATVASTAFVSCLSYGNSGATSHGFSFGNNARVLNCVAYNNGGSGFTCSTNSVNTLFNCIAENNAAFGFVNSGVNALLLKCASYNNTSGAKSGTFATDIGFVTGSASFFVDAANDNFALNTSAGGGASARAAGIPGVFPAGLTTGYLDIGAVQHADPAAGAGIAKLVGQGLAA